MLSRAALLLDYADGPQIVDLDVPALKTGEILVEIDAAPVSSTDTHITSGQFPLQAALPLILGREGTGRILEAKGRASDVNGRPLDPGERIVWAQPWCGHCFNCAIAGEPTLCERTFGYGWGPSPLGRLNGTYSEYFVVAPESKVLVVPSGLDPALVASAVGAVGAIIHSMTRLPRCTFSDQVVIVGSGPLGLYATAVALARGVAGVHLVAGPRENVEITSDWGLASHLDRSSTSLGECLDEIASRTGGRGVDVVIDCDDHAQPVESRIDVDIGHALLRPGGTYLALGETSGDMNLVTSPGLIRRQFNGGSFGAEIVHFDGAISFLDRYADRFSLAEMVKGHRYTLDETGLALGALRSGEDVKPLIYPTT